MSMTIHSSIKARILEAQSEASKVIITPAERLQGFEKQLERKEDNGLYFVERIRVLAHGNLRTLIMNKAHTTKYSIHPRADKIQSRTSETLRITLTASDSHEEIGEDHYGLPNREDYKMEIFSRLYIKEIVAGHGVPVSIIYDRDRPELTWEREDEMKQKYPQLFASAMA
ncbi:hypothetical protein Tco_1393155 [Tanacetum coccineum]